MKLPLAPPPPRVGDDDGDDGDGRILPDHPSPILHAPRDNVSCKGKSLTPIYIYIIYTWVVSLKGLRRIIIRYFGLESARNKPKYCKQRFLDIPSTTHLCENLDLQDLSAFSKMFFEFGLV